MSAGEVASTALLSLLGQFLSKWRNLGCVALPPSCISFLGGAKSQKKIRYKGSTVKTVHKCQSIPRCHGRTFTTESRCIWHWRSAYYLSSNAYKQFRVLYYL